MRRMRDSPTAHALRHRSGQAIALFLLALLGVAACVFGPLYGRSVEAAQLRSTLSFAPVADRGLAVRAGTAGSVEDLLPAGRLRSYYKAPVRSTTLNITFPSASGRVNGSVVNRDDQCAHLHIVAGVCPTTPDGMVASTSSAAYLHLSVGSHVPVTSAGLNPNPVKGTPTRPLVLTVVGLYATFTPQDEYWFGHRYSTPEGVFVIGPVTPGTPGELVADAFFARSGFPRDLAANLTATAASSVLTSADLPLNVDRVGLDDLSTLRRGITALARRDAALSAGSTVQTQLQPYLLDQVDHARHQTRAVVPAFAGELAMLILVVIAIVVVAGAEHRQPDVALARLRGNSIRRSARLVVRELGGPVLLAVVPGVVLGFVICAAACKWWLGGRAGPELRWPVVAAAAAVTVLELLLVAWGGRRTARRPVADLLRRVPSRITRRRVGVLEAAAGAMALSGVAVLRSGAADNPLAVITPALMALVAGLVLSRLAGGVATWAGRRALWRGRLATGLAGLQIARRPGARRAVILLCVAAALIVSAVDQWSVSARNRSARAQVQAGAAVVLTTRTSTAAQLVAAVAVADPSDRYATAVIRQVPLTGPPVLAVDPPAFGRIATWGWASRRPGAEQLARLDPPRPAPVTFTGTTLRLDVAGVAISRRRESIVRGTPGPVSLLIRVVRTDGTGAATLIGPLPDSGRATSHAAALVAQLPCTAGCRLASIGLQRTTTDAGLLTVDARITGLSAGVAGSLRPVDLGAAGDWTPTPDLTDEFGHRQSIRLSADGSTLRLHVVNSTAVASLQQDYVPSTLPAITTGALGLSADAQGNLTDANIDAVPTAYTPVGSLPFVPGAGGPALLVDRKLAMLTATPGLLGSSPEVWLADDNPARERTLTAVLARRGVAVVQRDSSAQHIAPLNASAPAWSMQVALVTAALAVLIAALVIAMSAATTRRGRTQDASAMALVGVERATVRRAALIEHLVAGVVAVLVGAAVGVLAARLTLPSIPMFVQDATVPAVLLPVAWGRVLVATTATLLDVGAVSAVVAVLVSRRQRW